MRIRDPTDIGAISGTLSDKGWWLKSRRSHRAPLPFSLSTGGATQGLVAGLSKNAWRHSLADGLRLIAHEPIPPGLKSIKKTGDCRNSEPYCFTSPNMLGNKKAELHKMMITYFPSRQPMLYNKHSFLLWLLRQPENLKIRTCSHEIHITQTNPFRQWITSARAPWAQCHNYYNSGFTCL